MLIESEHLSNTIKSTKFEQFFFFNLFIISFILFQIKNINKFWIILYSIFSHSNAYVS